MPYDDEMFSFFRQIHDSFKKIYFRCPDGRECPFCEMDNQEKALKDKDQVDLTSKDYSVSVSRDIS